MSQEQQRELISLVLAAKKANCSPRTVRRWIATGVIPGYRVGPRLVRVDAADIDGIARQIPAAGVSA